MTNNIKLQAALHSSLANLRARHRSLVEHREFKTWQEHNQAGSWHEVISPGGDTVTIVVQSAMDGTIFCALLERDTGVERETAEGARIIRCHEIKVGSDKRAPNKMEALAGVSRRVGLLPCKHVIRPVVDLLERHPSLKWVVEHVVPGRIDRYEICGGQVEKLNVVFPMGDARLPGMAPPPPAAAGADDHLASNNLHHVALFTPLALSLTKDSTSTEDKARRLFSEVVRRMAYDQTIDGISQFTWADVLVVNQLGWRGLCDEFSVVLITLLRALKIPARMKLLYWRGPDGRDAAHACVEWRDDKGGWRHMDPTWKTRDRPGTYRDRGATDVTVMNAIFPDDGLADEPAWGLSDRGDDLRLHPYKDYVLNPDFPGGREPGYSE